ncbi:MAG: CYTH and CHAD domain-containing protein [Frankiales bacterium]|nr:CYTH and CHAD domain-containing protein [Frankiales bacterium]
MVREVEAKFRVHPPFRIPDLEGEATGVTAVTPPRVQELRAVYWDTADLRLAREGVTLRHRSGEGDGDGWHLKFPVHEAGVPDASTGTREELHSRGPEDAVPDELRDLVAVYVRTAVIGPVATLLTTRSASTLHDAEGRRLAELTDDLVSVLNQGHVAARFREIEVEDAGGGLDVLQAVGTVLRTAGAVGGEFVPKVVRALGPQATADPDPPKPAPVNLSDPARDAIQAILRRYVRAFMTQDPAVRRGLPDSVHQMRVAARRLRSALKTFGPLVDDVWAKSLRAELKWVADSLGAARDNEVLLARLLTAIDALPPEDVVGSARSRLESELGGDLANARAAAVETLRSERYMALVDRLVDAAWDPMTTGLAEAKTRDALTECIGSAWKRLARDATRLQRPDATDEDWHETRIAAKQVRYAAEAVAPFFGKEAKGLAVQAEGVQELLGEHQDAAIASAVLRRLASAPRAGAGSFTLGLLYAGERRAVDDARAAFADVWKDAAKPRHRKWLRG